MVVHSYIYYIKFFTESRVTVQILLCFINHGLIYICWLISTVYLNSLILFTCLNIISHVTAMLWFFERLRLHFTVWLQQLPDAALGFSCTPRYAVSEKLKQLSPLPGERYLNWQLLVYYLTVFLAMLTLIKCGKLSRLSRLLGALQMFIYLLYLLSIQAVAVQISRVRWKSLYYNYLCNLRHFCLWFDVVVHFEVAKVSRHFRNL